MKDLGIGICIIGSIIAILYVPCQFLGINAGWYFILGDAGFGMKNYQLINTGLLILELILINGIGLAFFFFGKSKK
jgi:hypothetical protein